jgi:hypothetical protein
MQNSSWKKSGEKARQKASVHEYRDRKSLPPRCCSACATGAKGRQPEWILKGLDLLMIYVESVRWLVRWGRIVQCQSLAVRTIHDYGGKSSSRYNVVWAKPAHMNASESLGLYHDHMNRKVVENDEIGFENHRGMGQMNPQIRIFEGFEVVQVKEGRAELLFLFRRRVRRMLWRRILQRMGLEIEENAGHHCLSAQLDCSDLGLGLDPSVPAIPKGVQRIHVQQPLSAKVSIGLREWWRFPSCAIRYSDLCLTATAIGFLQSTHTNPDVVPVLQPKSPSNSEFKTSLKSGPISY